jgi:hypothetical protein
MNTIYNHYLFHEEEPEPSKLDSVLNYCYQKRFLLIAALIHGILISLFADHILLSAWFKNEEVSTTFVTPPKPKEYPIDDSTKVLSVSTEPQQMKESLITSMVRPPQVITTASAPMRELPLPTEEKFSYPLNDSNQVGFDSKVKFVTEKNLFGMRIAATKLAVVLDVSGSMSHSLPLVKEEVLSQFPDAIIIFSNSCSFLDIKKESIRMVEKPKDVRRFFSEISFPVVFIQMRHAVEYAKTIEGVDGVWLVSDFRDAVSPEVVEALAAEYQKKGIKLYLHLTNVKPGYPHKSLLSFCDVTGGQYIGKTIRPEQTVAQTRAPDRKHGK